MRRYREMFHSLSIIAKAQLVATPWPRQLSTKLSSLCLVFCLCLFCLFYKEVSILP